jgi:hypothetical protein
VQTEYIDEQLPFSEEEFYRAFRLVESDREARDAVALVVHSVREANEGAERARRVLASGIPEGSNLGVPTWVIGDVAFALLSLVSDDLRARVDAYMGAKWESEREQMLLNGLYRPGGMSLREPTPEVHAAVDARLAEMAADWRELVDTTRAGVGKRQ